MSHMHSSTNYNTLPPAAITPAPPPVTSQVFSLLSGLLSRKSDAPMKFSMPALPVKEILGGVSNIVRGLVLNDNWWIALLLILLFFPNIGNRMVGGLLKDLR